MQLNVPRCCKRKCADQKSDCNQGHYRHCCVRDSATKVTATHLNKALSHHSALSVGYGKTDAARRTLPMTPRVRCILEARWLGAGKPTSGWVFPVKASKSGHITHSSLKKAHAKALKLSKVEPFVIYSLRHTLATRLATPPGMDAWTLGKIMGWSSLAVAMRYIHPSEQRVLDVFEQKHELSETG